MTIASESVASRISAPCSSLQSTASALGDQPCDPEADVELAVPHPEADVELDVELAEAGALCPSSRQGQEVDPSRSTAIVTKTSQNPLPPATLDHFESKLSDEICISSRISSRSSLSSVGTHSFYASGEERPLLRGWLHGIIGTFVLPAALGAITLARSFQIIPSQWIMMELLLAGKLMSYAASGMLHLCMFQESEAVKRASGVDIVMIPVSIGASVLPFTQQFEETLIIANIQAMFVAFTVVEVVRRHSQGLPIETGGVRVCLIVTQWIGSVFMIGSRTGFESPLWNAMFLSYAVAFLFYGAKAWGQGRRMPWHRHGWYGWHEDFHTFLFVADMWLITLAAHFLTDSDSV